MAQSLALKTALIYRFLSNAHILNAQHELCWPYPFLLGMACAALTVLLLVFVHLIVCIQANDNSSDNVRGRVRLLATRGNWMLKKWWFMR
jgi:hypothetical protein